MNATRLGGEGAQLHGALVRQVADDLVRLGAQQVLEVHRVACVEALLQPALDVLLCMIMWQCEIQ